MGHNVLFNRNNLFKIVLFTFKKLINKKEDPQVSPRAIKHYLHFSHSKIYTGSSYHVSDVPLTFYFTEF